MCLNNHTSSLMPASDFKHPRARLTNAINAAGAAECVLRQLAVLGEALMPPPSGMEERD